MTQKSRDRYLSKCRGFDLKIEPDYGILCLTGSFEYEDWGSQGFGYTIDEAFLRGFLNVFGRGVSIQEVNGRSCWVTVESRTSIVLIEPLHKGDGEPFDVSRWVETWKERHHPYKEALLTVCREAELLILELGRRDWFVEEVEHLGRAVRTARERLAKPGG